MYVVAVLGDLFGMIPFVNIVVDGITAFVLWLMSSGTPEDIFADDQFIATFVTMGLEAVPGISMIPAWTIRVYFAKKQAAKKKKDA